MDTADLLKLGNATLDHLDFGSSKATASKALTPTVPTTASLGTGDFMNRKQVERLVDLTVGQSGWLSTVTVRTRNQRSGEIPRLEISDVVTEGVPENGMKTVSTHPDTDNVPYDCTKYQATWYMTLEDVREAAAAGEGEFEKKVRKAFAKAMGNDMARAALRGDEDLDNSTRLNRLLRQNDGWIKLIRANSGNRAATTRGSAFARSVFPSLIASMPEAFRDDPDLKWFLTGLLDLEWSDTLAGYSGSSGSKLGDDALQKRKRWAPYGIPQLVVPQLPADLGFASVSGSTSNADAVTDDGDGTMTIQVDTLLGGYAASNAGRSVKVTFSSNGNTETLTVIDQGGENRILTTGSLGQGTISTTVGDYALDLADLTPVILTNPKNLFIVLCDQMRAYRKWEQEGERWRIDVFYEADFGVFNQNAVAMQDGVIVPKFTFGS